MTDARPALTVIVPAYRCAGMLRASLDGLMASDLPRTQWELVVVDDGSPDDTADVARDDADTVLTIADGPRGPAHARNRGATVARGDTLVFIDADVVVSRHTLSGFAALFASQPDLVAAFGAYDDEPADPGFVSQYRNLLHRYVHMAHAGDASTFWAGCGAVRRDAFLSLGGFDAVRYPRPQIEDIDLGYRLADHGMRIALVPELTGKHLKRWTFANMVRTDLRERAVPWMHLLLEQRTVQHHGPLNLAAREKLFTLLVGAAILCLMVAAVTWSALWLYAALFALAIVVAGNASLIAWFAQRRGALFALRVIPLRLLFYLVGGLGAAWALLTHRSQPARSPLPALGTVAERVVAP